MKRRSPRLGNRHVTHISAHKTARILHALHQRQCGYCGQLSVKRIAPTRLREYFTHCAKHGAVGAARRGGGS
ncbi:unnamed protein product [Bemisia tabaci]|uniref:Uncharacterized protein n=1 Tax=Bemisia tabaci TaxID=7038 RepID=A0A9P0AFE1_BEMTA|nr:unnamed protein product [Bemisia tabaci]